METPENLHKHEAMDRLHVALCNLDDHLYKHPWVKANLGVANLIWEAEKKLQEAYKLAGKT